MRAAVITRSGSMEITTVDDPAPGPREVVAVGNLCERWATIGVTNPGPAAEFVAAPVANCAVLPENVRTEDAALIEPLSCAVRGFDVLRVDRPPRRRRRPTATKRSTTPCPS